MSTTLQTCFDDVAANSIVDFENRQVADLSHALEKQLWKYTKRMQKKNGKLEVLDLRQCGSMVERTALWKSSQRNNEENKYLEFDYLAVMDGNKYAIYESENSCHLCAILKDKKKKTSSINSLEFDMEFLSTFYSSIMSLCSCHVSMEPDSSFACSCAQCSEETENGFLRIANIRNCEYKEKENCSIMFYWISKTEDLKAPDVESLQVSETIRTLAIRVDIMPAFEINPNCVGNRTGKLQYLIPKDCPSGCLNTWMRSYCILELNALKHLSPPHRNCYIVIKFLYGQLSYWTGVDVFLKGYHAKVAFINHCQICTNNTLCYTSCINSILAWLKTAYKKNNILLPFSDFRQRLFYERDVYKFAKLEGLIVNILCLEHIITETTRHFSRYHICQTQRTRQFIAIVRETALDLKKGRIWVDKHLSSLQRQSVREDFDLERYVITRMDGNLITMSTLNDIFDEFRKGRLVKACQPFEGIPLGLRIYRLFDAICAVDQQDSKAARELLKNRFPSICETIHEEAPACDCNEINEAMENVEIIMCETPRAFHKRTRRAKRTRFLQACCCCFSMCLRPNESHNGEHTAMPTELRNFNTFRNSYRPGHSLTHETRY